jgi:hypothetical protein
MTVGVTWAQVLSRRLDRHLLGATPATWVPTGPPPRTRSASGCAGARRTDPRSGGFEGLVEAGPVDAAGLESEVGFLEKVLETALTSAITTV